MKDHLVLLIGTEGVRLLREKRSRGLTARGKRVPVVEITVEGFY
ncbi:hypothetical protein [Peribacillus simplex]|nr:hypothetical protein [Peribacillus simplex]